jgi:serine/threonine protein phosphatase PrpC
MSRSIGDRIAKRIGVIATPVLHNFSLYPQDQFIVLGSDGIWDVMENIEVINFVDSIRKSCSNPSDLYPARPCNSSVSRLLCEEARLRWFKIIEEEDVMIDDISCIVLEIRRNDETLARHSKRPVPMEEVAEAPHEVEPQEGLRRAPTLKEIAVRDPRRGSIVEDRIAGLDI